MNAERIAQALDGRREGRSWKCDCPIHSGHHLRVTEKDGKVLVFCFQGASQQQLIEALEEMGLWT